MQPLTSYPLCLMRNNPHPLRHTSTRLLLLHLFPSQRNKVFFFSFLFPIYASRTPDKVIQGQTIVGVLMQFLSMISFSANPLFLSICPHFHHIIHPTLTVILKTSERRTLRKKKKIFFLAFCTERKEKK